MRGWLIVAGSSPLPRPLYFADERLTRHWTTQKQLAKRYPTREAAETEAQRYGLVSPRYVEIE